VTKETENRLLLREAHKRFTPPASASVNDAVIADVRRKLRASLFDRQQDFFDDPAERKTACCSRRAGKTNETAADAVDGPLETPGSRSLYLTLTRERAKDLLWPDLHKLNHELQIGLKFNEVELTAKLPEMLGGGGVKLSGVPNASEIEKFRGGKLKRVRIDEAQSFGAYLKELVEDVLDPALLDLQGDLGLLGTPGPVCTGLFYEASTGKLPGWSRHHWTVLDNPFVPHAKEWLARKKAQMGWTDDSPTYRREWLGEWVQDTGALFYRFRPALHTYSGELPKGHEWRYVLGWDLGWSDAMALVLLAFSDTCPHLYEAYSWKQSGITPSQVMEGHVLPLIETYRPIALVADTGGIGKAVVEDVAQRYRVRFEAAEKKEKLAGVEMLNDDFDRARVVLRAGSPWARELEILPKDPEDPTKEDARFDNHCADAGLYAFRKCRHFWGKEPVAGPAVGTREFEEAQAEARENALASRLLERQRQRKDEETWEW
jgi:hypothetical protein